MITGHLIKVAGGPHELNHGSWFQWRSFDVCIASRQDGIRIWRKGAKLSEQRPPIINLELSPAYLLSLIGKGRYHQVEGRWTEGVRSSQADAGTVDLVGGIAAQRDGPDRHRLGSLEFSYSEDDRQFCMLFDVTYGEGIPGMGCNGWSVHADVKGYRFWVRCDTPWSELYALHEWATAGRGSLLPSEVLFEALGIDVPHPSSLGTAS